MAIKILDTKDMMVYYFVVDVVNTGLILGITIIPLSVDNRRINHIETRH